MQAGCDGITACNQANTVTIVLLPLYMHVQPSIVMVMKMELFIHLRRQRGWSQAELARRAGMHPSTISFAESGRFHLSTAQITKLAGALGVGAAALLEDDPAGLAGLG
jgi:DNA-binding XRE family transcriptional regulator